MRDLKCLWTKTLRTLLKWRASRWTLIWSTMVWGILQLKSLCKTFCQKTLLKFQTIKLGCSTFTTLSALRKGAWILTKLMSTFTLNGSTTSNSGTMINLGASWMPLHWLTLRASRSGGLTAIGLIKTFVREFCWSLRRCLSSWSFIIQLRMLTLET